MGWNDRACRFTIGFGGGNREFHPNAARESCGKMAPAGRPLNGVRDGTGPRRASVAFSGRL